MMRGKTATSIARSEKPRARRALYLEIVIAQVLLGGTFVATAVLGDAGIASAQESTEPIEAARSTHSPQAKAQYSHTNNAARVQPGAMAGVREILWPSGIMSVMRPYTK